MISRLRAWLHERAAPVAATRRQERYTRALADQNARLGACPACGADSRGIYPSLFHLVEASEDERRERIPVAVMVCTTCGLTHLFDASVIGLTTVPTRQ